MKDNILKDKSLDFAIRIVNLYKYMQSQKRETVMSTQLLRSGTSIGANISEALFAESHADFIHKLSISQKECAETIFWLTVIQKTQFITEEEHDSIYNDCVELMKLLTSTIVTLKKKGKVNN